MMMRVGLIVVGLSALAIMELATPPRTTTSAPDRFEQLALDASIETLEMVDRREVHHLQHESLVAEISPVEPTSTPNLAAIISEKDLSTVQLGTNDKKHVVKKLSPKPKYTTGKRTRPKLINSNRAPKTERFDAMVEHKPCRPGAFDGLLKALNLSSRCRT
ncbi:MAG: hypothetical protein HY852_19510 [Bradyrhizobium sp.]|uniref:hypothetical protein n=1 Tax=Bradyrhizobium sp. TaxID=376 RepID=UPI0025B85F3D|nr:hypothetical protein [Bradyrhizobium sp.]MBI5263998.1 hypothetical protein [Bradyrhizobium sp.]